MSETVIFQIPELAQRPFVGGGCCATTSEWLIEEGLNQLPGVEEVHASDENGEVRVRFDPERIDAHQIAEALGDLGFTPDLTATPQTAAQMACCVE